MHKHFVIEEYCEIMSFHFIFTVNHIRDNKLTVQCLKSKLNLLPLSFYCYMHTMASKENQVNRNSSLRIIGLYSSTLVLTEI